MENTSAQLPKYQCHKEVCALKIKEIELSKVNENEYIITPEEKYYTPFIVSKDYWEKHKPQLGGYYVVYKDGYKSYSPQDAFEDGYSLISPLGQ